MPFAEIDGIATRYEVVGDGPPLLMYLARRVRRADREVDRPWRLQAHPAARPPAEALQLHPLRPARERPVGRPGRADHLGRITCARAPACSTISGIERAHLMGGCMGCCPVAAFARGASASGCCRMVLYWPVGGANYRISGHQRFARHLAFVEENGLQAVVDLVRSHDKNFCGDPRGGPWGQPIRNSDEFAAAYAALDVERLPADRHRRCIAACSTATPRRAPSRRI